MGGVSKGGVQLINSLPQSATLVSYFIFAIVLFLITALTGVGIHSSLSGRGEVGRAAFYFLHCWKFMSLFLRLEPNTPLANYFRYLEAVSTPTQTRGFSLVEKFRPPAGTYWSTEGSGFFHTLCFLPIHHFAIPRMAWPRTFIYRSKAKFGWRACRAIRNPCYFSLPYRGCLVPASHDFSCSYAHSSSSLA